MEFVMLVQLIVWVVPLQPNVQHVATTTSWEAMETVTLVPPTVKHAPLMEQPLDAQHVKIPTTFSLLTFVNLVKLKHQHGWDVPALTIVQHSHQLNQHSAPMDTGWCQPLSTIKPSHSVWPFHHRIFVWLSTRIHPVSAVNASLAIN